MEQALYNTPLVEEHIALGAKMVGFGGWNMPLQYEGILAEWDHNRKTCSVFDCSHMGEFLIKGDAVKSGLDHIVTQTIADMPLKTCRYGMMLNARGGVIDDLIVYRKAADEWMIVVNAANIEKNARHFKANLTSAAQFTDISMAMAKLDAQGPLSRDVLMPLVPDIKKLKYYSFDEFMVLGQRCLISRTGYTGELGYEIYCAWDQARAIWQALLKDPRVKPTGLGARDVLRIEVCYPLYGHELDEHISPLQAGLGKFIDWNKDFIGRSPCEAHKAVGAGRALVCIVSDTRRSPRARHKTLNESGRM
ncbi:MAG: glycine cleavage system aminomethyltransferase GcvT, partial [Candidatus Omnitrophica bacterium]|nr:glycine cleavage system aminomethyltransferase GcvT [Candidatus Omnitrophota bacterium]